VDQGTIINVFRITYVHPFYIDTSIDKEIKNPPIITKEDPLTIIKKNRLFVNIPNKLSIRSYIKIRIPRRTKEELERGLIKYIPLLDTNTFTVFLPSVVNNKPDPCTFD